jgi:hypothetical protein
MVSTTVAVVKQSFEDLTSAVGRQIFKPLFEHEEDPEMTSRVLDCPCGLTLTGSDDEDLFRKGRAHADEHHADDGITDDFIRQHVAANARDAVEA